MYELFLGNTFWMTSAGLMLQTTVLKEHLVLLPEKHNERCTSFLWDRDLSRVYATVLEGAFGVT